jgi:transposase
MNVVMKKTTQLPMAPVATTAAAASYVALVGIDWADQEHTYSLQVVASQKVHSGKFAQTPEAIQDWINQLRQWTGPGKIAVALEASRGPLIHALMKYDHLVLYPINPKSVANYRTTFQPSSAKDDPSDGALILDLLVKHRDQLRPWQPDDALTRQLALLVEHRRDLVEQHTALINALGAALKAYYPQALALLDGQLGSRMAVDFLRHWPTLEAAQKAAPHRLRKFFYGHNSRSAERWQQRQDLLQRAVPLTTDPAIIASYALRAGTLANQLAALLPSLADYDQQIAHLFHAHALYPLFDALPGAGDVLAPRLLAAFGSRPERFAHADELARFTGTAPVTVQSGKSKQVHWRWARPKFLHQSFVEFAQQSTRFCPWARCYYEYHLGRGRGKWAALRRLAIRWQRILWKCVQTGTHYDEARYLAQLKKKGEEPYAKLDHFMALFARKAGA